jgi:hypothetical protein
MKPREMKNLLNRAAAALETPQDLNDQDRTLLAMDLVQAAQQFDPEAYKSRVIVVVFPIDTQEDVGKVAQELQEMLALGQYDAEVITPEPDLEEFILARFEADPPTQVVKSADVPVHHF